MTTYRPITKGTVSGSTMDRVRELKDGEDLLVPSRILGANDEDRLAEFLDSGAVAGMSPRGPVPYQDLRRGCVILAQCTGIWTAGTVVDGSGIETNPEKITAYYRTRADGNYSATGVLTGSVVADDIVTDGAGATYRVVSHNGGAKTLVLSLYQGTTSTPVTLTVSSGGAPGSTITDCVISPAGSTTGYSDTSGEKAPFINAGGVVSGYFNCIGSRQNDIFGDSSIYNRFPERPEFYESFQVPNNEFAEGAELEIVMSGVWKNDAAGSSALYFVLNIGEDIFTTTGLGLANNRARMRFTVPLPTSASEVPFIAAIRMTSHRTDERSEANVALLTFETDSATWGGSGAYRVALQRGSDRETSPTTYPGFNFEGDDDDDPEVRAVGVWMAVGSDSGLGKGIVASGECYATVHTMQARLYREGIA